MSGAAELSGVAAALARRPSSEGGRCVMFISAGADEGASRMARDFALLVEQTSRRGALLLDLDMKADGQARHFAGGEEPLGSAKDARFGGVSLVRLLDAKNCPLPNGDKALCVRQVGGKRLFVSQLRLPETAARIQVASGPDYWRAARSMLGHIVVDAPSLARSEAGLSIARHMDGVVLVVSGTHGAAAAAVEAKAALERQGASIMGLVYTDGVDFPGARRAG
jgi:Mrp family chromosome partitioning ATPase